jgi:ferric-dicitrate binding protein FerR (iron transport regulator)
MRIVTYEDVAVREVVDDFNRYFEQKLGVEGQSLLDRRVTIRLHVDDRTRAIETLASLLDARVVGKGAGEILVN